MGIELKKIDDPKQGYKFGADAGALRHTNQEGRQ